MNCIFCKIAQKEIPKELLYEDRDVIAFEDIRPAKPVHLLIVPKKHIGDFLDIEDTSLLGKIGHTIQTLVKEKKLEKKGYRILLNGGGAQIVHHLHFHLLGPMGMAVED